MRVHCIVNGEIRTCDEVWEGESLLQLLRERLGLFGSKDACGEGQCGSCSVLLDAKLVCACLVPAGQADGGNVVTIEGLHGHGNKLHPIQEALLESGAIQCGFCIPGFVMSIHDLLTRVPSPTDVQIRAGLTGNLCRCGGYNRIIEAVRTAARRMQGPSST
jgi:carbon-monoxide dehydrogenase small subunit